MDSKNQMPENDDENSSAEPSKENRIFLFDEFSVKYLNTSQIIYTRSQFGRDVKVDNFLCYQDGKNLSKITKISYQDKVVMIQDKFQVCPPPQNNHSLQQENQQIFYVPKSIEKFNAGKRDDELKQEKQHKMGKKDKKNIVKNIIKIFLSWLQKKKNEKHNEKYEEPLAELKKIISEENFNNRLIKRLMSNNLLSQFFLNFLIDDAEEEVKYSRIHDKQSHYEALQFYKNLLDHSIKNTKSNAKELSEKKKMLISNPFQPSDQTKKQSIFNQEMIPFNNISREYSEQIVEEQ